MRGIDEHGLDTDMTYISLKAAHGSSLLYSLSEH